MGRPLSFVQSSSYPPFEITAEILTYIAEIAELVGKISSANALSSSPTLRRANFQQHRQAAVSCPVQQLGNQFRHVVGQSAKVQNFALLVHYSYL